VLFFVRVVGAWITGIVLCVHMYMSRRPTGPSIATRARRGDACEHTHAAWASALAPYLIQYVRAAGAGE